MARKLKAYGLIPWLMLFFLSLVWGTSFILIKKSLLTFTAPEVGSLRILLACLPLFPFAIKPMRVLSKKTLFLLFLVGFIGALCPALLFALAQTRITSSLAGVINALTPLFVLVIGFLFFRIPLSGAHTLGILLGFAGCLLVLAGGSFLDFSLFNSYALYAIVASGMYGINVHILKHYLSHLKPLHITAISFVLISPMSLAYLSWGTTFFQKIGTPTFFQGLMYVAILALLGTAVALIVFYQLIKDTSPLFASSVTYMIPLVAIGWGLIDGEALDLYQGLGMGIVLMGVYLANKQPH